MLVKKTLSRRVCDACYHVRVYCYIAAKNEEVGRSQSFGGQYQCESENCPLATLRSTLTPRQVCKLYLYNNEHALALSHHTTHMRKFSDFSRGWGIGEETFEFWSWMARQ
jgi:hypothetical protein